jgi:hypothetical protein
MIMIRRLLAEFRPFLYTSEDWELDALSAEALVILALQIGGLFILTQRTSSMENRILREHTFREMILVDRNNSQIGRYCHELTQASDCIIQVAGQLLKLPD